MILYSAANAPNGVRFAKWDEDMNVLSVSTVSRGGAACDCKAGARPTCRHRQMYWTFAQEHRIGTEWYLDFDTKAWHRLDATPPAQADVPENSEVPEPSTIPQTTAVLDKPWRRPV